MTVATVDIAIIGSGPYGLSLAAHLRDAKRSFRIFGAPMSSWSHHMPQGMSLKSEGFASDLSDPQSQFTLQHYCAEESIPYAAVGLPVRIETFIAYGLEFQRRYVPSLERAQITSVKRSPSGFELTVDTGETLHARTVVVAAGIMHFAYLPPALAALPTELVTHSSRHSDLSGFKGRKVAVLGAGASAIDIAVLLQRAGAEVDLIARRPAIQFHDPPVEPRPLLDRLKAPRSGLGTGWRSRLSTDIPTVFHALPESLRLRAVAGHLGPAPCWFTRDDVVGRLPLHLGVTVGDIKVSGDKVDLALRSAGKPDDHIKADHLIAGTGYKVSLSRLGFIDPALRSTIRAVVDTPILNRQFESSADGLYFVGATSANSFGPLLRFAYGAKFAANRLATHLARA